MSKEYLPQIGKKMTIQSHEQKRSSRPLLVYRNDFRPPEVISKIGFTGTKDNELWNAHWAKHVVPTAGSKRGLRYYGQELGRTRKLQGTPKTIHQYEINATGLNHVNLRDYVKTRETDVMKAKMPHPYFHQTDFNPSNIKPSELYHETLDDEKVKELLRRTKPNPMAGSSAITDYRKELMGNVHHNHEITVLEQIPPHRIRYLGQVTLDNTKVKIQGLQDFTRSDPKDKRTTVNREQSEFRREYGTSRPNIVSRKAEKKTKLPAVQKSKKIQSISTVNLNTSTITKGKVKDRPPTKKEMAKKKKEEEIKKKLKENPNPKLSSNRKVYRSPEPSPQSSPKLSRK